MFTYKCTLDCDDEVDEDKSDNVFTCEITIIENAPDKPEAVWATKGESDAYVEISWETAEGAWSYDVYRSVTDSLPSDASPIRCNLTGNSVRDMNAVPGVKYYYWVKAIGAYGVTLSDSNYGYRKVAVSLSVVSATVGGDSHEGSVTVVANTLWSASADASWITIETSSGNGNGSMTYTIEKNTSSTERIGTITITAGADTSYPMARTITITQKGGKGEAPKIPTPSIGGCVPSRIGNHDLLLISWTNTVSYADYRVIDNTIPEIKAGFPQSLSLGSAYYSIYGYTPSTIMMVEMQHDQGILAVFASKYEAGKTYYFWVAGISEKSEYGDSDISEPFAFSMPYTITYQAGSCGSGTVNPSYKTKGVDLTLLGESFTRDGYVQTGWSLTDGAISNDYDLCEVYAHDASITLYPVWTRQQDVPPAPTGLSATDGSYVDRVIVSWTEASGAMSYNLYRSATEMRPDSPIMTGVTSSCDDATATPGVKYYYWVEAVNTAGSSFSESDTGYRAVSLALGKATDSYAAAGGSGSVSVTANTSWIATKDVSWITLGTSSGDGNGTLAYTVAANMSADSRTGAIMVTAGSATSYPVTKSITVTQEGTSDFVIVDGVLTEYTGTGSAVTIPDGVTSIGDSAFLRCYGLTSVTMPSSVISVGDYAFYECSGLTWVSIPSGVTRIGEWAFAYCCGIESVSIPSSVLSIGVYAFHWCDELTTVYVEAGDESRVREVLTDSGLDCSGITFASPTVEEKLTWYTTKAEAFAAAEESGKRILLLYGRETCAQCVSTRDKTCEAAAVKEKLLDGYVLWYSNCDTQSAESRGYLVNYDGHLPGVSVIDVDLGEGIVGTSGGLDVAGMLALLESAENYEPPEIPEKEPPAWTPVVKGMNLTLYAQVYDKAADAYLDAEGSVLAAFDANGECRGKVSVMTGPNGIRVYQLTVGYESSGERGVTLKLWDAASGEIIDIPASEILYASSQLIGKIAEPVVYQVGVLTQDITLNEGWNWVSTFLTVEENDVGTFFGDFEFADDDVVKGEASSATYFDCAWYPDDFKIEPCRAYVVKKSAGGTESHQVEGFATEGAISVDDGWNWFGSCSSAVKTVADLRHSKGFSDDDIIKGALESATYKNGNWYPSTMQLKPGVGYLAKLANGGEFTFEVGASSANAARNALVMKGMPNEQVAPDWKPVVKPGTFTVYARVKDAEGNYIDADGSLIAAFDGNGECRGVCAIDDGPTVKFYQLNVGVESDGEPPLTLKVWNAADGSVSEIGEKVSGNINDLIGTISVPIEYQIATGDPTPAVRPADFGMTFNGKSLTVDVGAQPSTWSVVGSSPIAGDYVESANGFALDLGACSAGPNISVSPMIASGKSFAISYFGTIGTVAKGVVWALRYSSDLQGLVFQQGTAGTLQLRWMKSKSSAETAIALMTGVTSEELAKPHHYLVQVSTGGVVSLYVDGVKAYSAVNATRNFTAHTYDGLSLGRAYGGADLTSYKHGNGVVDDFRVFTSSSESCLSEEEISILSASFSRGAIYPELPSNPTSADVYEALDGSADAHLQKCITEPTVYNDYRAWAETVKAPGGSTAAGAQAVKDSPNAWLSFALDSATLIQTPPADGDVKVEKFEQTATAGLFDFIVGVENIPVGDDATPSNLAKVFGIEGGSTLSAQNMSSDKVDITFCTPENGKVNFTAGPKDKTLPTFFMKVKIK